MINRFDFRGIERSAEDSVRQRLYIHGKDEVLDDVAMNIVLTFNWVADRSSKDVSQVNAELKTIYSNMKSVKEMLDDLVEKQAWMLWHFNGHKWQTEEEKKNDYHNAKRYIAFLLADKLLIKCRESKICPEQSLQPDYIEYLSCITIDEFARYKAYLRWHDRNKGNYVKDTDKQLQDYFTAIDFLDKTAINCKNRQCADSFEFWKKIIEGGNYPAKLEIIKRAKTNTLRRLLMANPEKMDYVGRFVANFYNNLEQFLYKNAASDSIVKEIVDSLYEESDVVNMFEFILKCFLVSRLTIEEHNQIRKKYNKPLLEAVLA